jgi:hypothetical protein
MPATLEADLPFDFLTLLGQADFGSNLMANPASALVLTEVMMGGLFG